MDSQEEENKALKMENESLRRENQDLRDRNEFLNLRSYKNAALFTDGYMIPQSNIWTARNVSPSIGCIGSGLIRQPTHFTAAATPAIPEHGRAGSASVGCTGSSFTGHLPQALSMISEQDQAVSASIGCIGSSLTGQLPLVSPGGLSVISEQERSPVRDGPPGLALWGSGDSSFVAIGPIGQLSRTSGGSSTVSQISAPKHKRKTVICKFYQSNECMRGDACTYAHGEEERRDVNLCWDFHEKCGKCSRGANCKFIHNM